MSLVNRLDRDSTYDQRLRHVLTERSSTSSSRRGMKRAPGSRNGISVRARSGRSGGERFFYTKRNKPWKVLCTFSYKVKMISSLSLRAVWKIFFSFSLAVSSGSFNCGGYDNSYISYIALISKSSSSKITHFAINNTEDNKLPSDKFQHSSDKIGILCHAIDQARIVRVCFPCLRQFAFELGSGDGHRF